MGFWDVFLIGVGLSMDAFAVSICKGLSVRKVQPRHALLAGGWFGLFQFLMPVLGYVLGVRFQDLIASVDHWIAFFLLAVIGGNMIREAVSGEEEKEDDDFGVRTMVLMAIATSIDALAVGITFAFLNVSILPAAGIIGVTTFVISAAGIYIGAFFGSRFQKWAELAGGIILILIGLKILLEHLGILVI